MTENIGRIEAIEKLIKLATDGVIARQMKERGKLDAEAGVREVTELCVACDLVRPRSEIK